MSEIDLPPPYMLSEYRSIPPRPPLALYTAEQVRQLLAAERAAERERCAKVCDDIAATKRMHARGEADDGEHAVAQMLQWKVHGAIDCAAAIRKPLA